MGAPTARTGEDHQRLASHRLREPRDEPDDPRGEHEGQPDAQSSEVALAERLESGITLRHSVEREDRRERSAADEPPGTHGRLDEVVAGERSRTGRLRVRTQKAVLGKVDPDADGDGANHDEDEREEIQLAAFGSGYAIERARVSQTRSCTAAGADQRSSTRRPMTVIWFEYSCAADWSISSASSRAGCSRHSRTVTRAFAMRWWILSSTTYSGPCGQRCAPTSMPCTNVTPTRSALRKSLPRNSLIFRMGLRFAAPAPHGRP